MRPRARHGTAVDSGQRNNTTARLCFLPARATIISNPRAPRARPLRWPLLPLLGRRPARFVRYRPAPRARHLPIATPGPRASLRCACAAASASPGADERGWALALACLPRLVFALSGPQLVHWYGGGSSFTPPPDLKLSSRFFFLSCDQAKKKRERKQSLAPCSSNIIRFVVVDSTAEYSRKKAIDFASRTGQHI